MTTKNEDKEERRRELIEIIQSINCGRELEIIEKIHKRELKKYHNHEGEL